MSGPTTSARTESGPESPTTARPLEMDDDDVQETGVLGDEATQKSSTTTPTTTGATESAEVPPPKPPRPVSQQEQNENTLKEAFPSVELPVIRAVLVAAGGRVERAFNALLAMTDPDSARQDEPPPQPPRPVEPPAGPTATPQSQLEADEQYARQLAQHYETDAGAYEARTSNVRGGYPRGGGGRPPQQTGLKPNEMWGDREHSFLDDDLPVIRENLRKGFVETQSKVNSWFTNLKKRIDEGFDEGDDDGSRPHGAGSGGAAGGAFMGRPTRDQSRRSADYDRYDADPELLSDDFSGIRLNPDGTPAGNQRPANPNLFKPPPPSKSPRPGSAGRKVAFNDNVEDINAYDASPRLQPKDASPAPAAGGKASKWQPLSTVEPSPIADNDPFSLGDSEDEKDAKAAGGGGGDKKAEDDAERLRKAAAEAMADSLVEENGTKAAAAAEKKE